MTRVYLSGKITGLPFSVYTANFDRAEKFYTAEGFDVVNPVKIGNELMKRKPDVGYEDFMQADLEALRTCSCIALIDGWEQSPGAAREKEETERLGLEVMQLNLFD